MIKINEDWSFQQPSIKCNYCIQHTVKLLWCICWDIIYATYLQSGIDLPCWMSYKRALECKPKEICGYWDWSTIWLIMSCCLNSPLLCIISCDLTLLRWFCFSTWCHMLGSEDLLVVLSFVDANGALMENWCRDLERFLFPSQLAAKRVVEAMVGCVLFHSSEKLW